MHFNLQVAGKTDIGSVRTNNEDNLGYDTRYGIFVVCDGMGGQAFGERASKIAVDSVLGFFRAGSNSRNTQIVGKIFDGVSGRANSLARAIQLANQSIFEESATDPSHTGMGSTIVAVCVEDDQFSIANVGDSRIYLIRAGTIQQLTHDHSLIMEQVRRGLMTMEEAEVSEMKNIIVRSVGVEESIEPDLADHEFMSEDILLLCSDGLSRFVQESTVPEIVTHAATLEAACDALIENAKQAGSDDNITCMLIKAIKRSRTEGILSSILPGRDKPKWQDSI